MQRNRHLVRQRDARDDAVDVFAGDGREQCLVQGAPDPFADRCRPAVHARFDRRVVRGLLTEPARRRIADDTASLVSSEQSMPRVGEVRIEPRLAAVDREWLEIEGDRRMDDVMVRR
jgi:hypothetical protein